MYDKAPWNRMQSLFCGIPAKYVHKIMEDGSGSRRSARVSVGLGLRRGGGQCQLTEQHLMPANMAMVIIWGGGSVKTLCLFIFCWCYVSSNFFKNQLNLFLRPLNVFLRPLIFFRHLWFYFWDLWTWFYYRNDWIYSRDIWTLQLLRRLFGTN